MKNRFSIATGPKLALPLYLILFSVVYSSCDQRVATNEPAKILAKDSAATETTLSAPEAVTVSLDQPVNSVASTMERYDQLAIQFRQIEKDMKDPAVTGSAPRSRELIARIEKIQWYARPAMTWYSQHRSGFSKEQVKKIMEDIDAIEKAADAMPH